MNAHRAGDEPHNPAGRDGRSILGGPHPSSNTISYVMWGQPSARVRELIRAGARAALDSGRDWVREVDHATLRSLPPVAADPELATVVRRANWANLTYFATAMLENPGAPVPPYLGAESLRMARELVRRGLDTSALEIYRVAQNLAWHRWTEITFELTSDPQELRELIDLPFRLVSRFVDGTLAGIAAQMRLESEYTGLTDDKSIERRELVQFVLDGAAVSTAQIETQLAYRFQGAHTAAIVWCEESEDASAELDQAVTAFVEAGRGRQSLSVAVGTSTRWVWIGEGGGFDDEEIGKSVSARVQIAIGNTAAGLDGFVRSHRDAVVAQQVVRRLRSPRRVARFAELQLVRLITEDAAAAAEFIEQTLGDFISASPVMQETVLTYINSGCNSTRAAKTLYAHRNTLLHRLDAAQRLLPRPLEQNLVTVAVALETLRWRGLEFDDPAGGHGMRAATTLGSGTE